MDNIKIVVNSSPRSGHAWLQMILHYATGYDNSVSIGSASSDSFIIRTNTPVMLLAKFEEIKQTVILRNPVELIPSIVTKTMGGLGNTTTSNIPMPHELIKIPPLKNLVEDQFEVYKRYLDGINNNIDNLYPFTFEDVTEDVEYVIKTLTGIHVDNGKIPDLINDANRRIRQASLTGLAYNNAVPVDKKPDVYYEAKDILLNSSKLDHYFEMYEECRDLILSRKLDA